MAGKNIQNAMLFNILSYMSDKLLTEGNTVATLDELYIWTCCNEESEYDLIRYPLEEDVYTSAATGGICSSTCPTP